MKKKSTDNAEAAAAADAEKADAEAAAAADAEKANAEAAAAADAEKADAAAAAAADAEKANAEAAAAADAETSFSVAELSDAGKVTAVELKSTAEALRRERAGYEARGLDERIVAVDDALGQVEAEVEALR